MAVTNLRTRKPWHFSISVLAPVVLAVVMTIAAVVAFLLWTAANTDQTALQRETHLVAHVLSEQVQAVVRGQESVAMQDIAVINTRINFNSRWIDEHLGTWMYTYYRHNRTYVLDTMNAPVYAMHEGKAVEPFQFLADQPALEPLIERVRKMIERGQFDTFRTGRRNAEPPSADLITLNGMPAIASVIPITSSSNYRLQQPGTEFLFVSIQFLDNVLAASISEKYLLAHAHFSLEQSGRDTVAVYPMMNSQGRFVAFFEWQPDRPGTRILSQTVPVLGVSFMIAGVVVMLLLEKLWKSSAELESGRRRAQHQATHDSLTGLPNRAMFETTLSAALTGPPPPGRELAVLMVDLDRFKYVNDTRGHLAGDALIQAVAKRIDTLIAAPNTVCRIGGDEFAVIFAAEQGESEVRRFANDLVAAIDKPFDIMGGEVFIGASIGISISADWSADCNEMVRKADIALYEAKAAGRNRAVVYREFMSEELQYRHKIEGDLRDALKSGGGQIDVVYQPLVCGQSHKVRGAEALVRWHHPVMGSISPVHFIPVAESTGLIEALGELILQRACKLGARWPNHTIAVNISPAQLRNPNFASKVFQMLSNAGMRPENLELEITEGILLDDEQVTTETLRRFRSAGIRIALDDFGTGYSSLNYLKQYAVDRIKIDRSFVSRIGDSEVSRAIVQAMVSLAQAMRIEVTAEGVETEDQRDVLAQMGCGTFQGYYFSPAVQSERIEEMFAHEGALTPRRRNVA